MLGLQYIKAVDRIARNIGRQSKTFSEAARLIVDSAVRGGYLYVQDPEYLISEEARTRAAGLCMVRQLRVSDLPPARSSVNDVVVAFSNRNFSEGEELLYREMKRKKFKIIGVLPKRGPRAGPELRSLQDYSELVIDSGVPGSVGVLSVPGFWEKLAPVDTVVNSIIVFALCAEVIGEFLRRGLKPSVFLSVRTQGAREHNTRVLKQYRRQGF